MKEVSKRFKKFNNDVFNMEMYDSTAELTKLTNSRPVTEQYKSYTSYGFNRNDVSESFTGVRSWDEVTKLLDTGYEAAVDKLDVKHLDLKAMDRGKVHTFEVTGYVPNIPLYLMGVPTCMQNTHKVPIKNRVVNVVYEMTVTADVDKQVLFDAGQALLGALLELEAKGYRYNLYVTQNYYDRGAGGDILTVKIKNSNTPLNIKRMSFSLVHPAFFRAVGFDWIERYPKGRFRRGLGHQMDRDYSEEDISEMFEELMGIPSVFFSVAELYKKFRGNNSRYKEYFKQKLEASDKKALK